MPPITSPSPSSKPRKSSQNPNPNSQTSSSSSFSFLCKEHPSPSATLDLLILLLVLFSSLFLISSILSYLSISLSLLLPSLNLSFLAFFLLLSLASFAAAEFCCGARGRRCRNPRCQGLKKATEFDVQLQTEECLRVEESKKEIDDLPWKGGSEGNPDYQCLIKELRRLAPANGRAVLLFRAKCGCAVAKLEAWGPKRGRRQRRSIGSLAIENGDR
ncbi:Ribosomal protein L34e superfamily protein [Cinnamomum micranthum f. kanehirae]|uniref:Ribosomal protein L34e superfamily protein n=1 Tax=Cinnamomum micranthum f. kanehirae TaxID=337451 RepID=A0A443PSD7_9MAGN|nr:Ribosomal protein L34e superfamily protein [Cinnamomum micranthum f. kanehirae]